MSFIMKKAVLSSLVAMGLVAGSVAPSFADSVKTPLPTLPSSVVRASTEGHGVPALNIPDALLKEGANPVAPEKVNDWHCRPTAAHPKPVVLLHGMGMTAYTAWSAFGPLLAAQGYCVFAPNMPLGDDAGSKVLDAINMGLRGMGKIEKSTVFAAAFVNEVLHATGASKVDIVGYSEGGTIVNLMLHTYDSSAIDKVATLGGINTGINPVGLQDKGLLFKDQQDTSVGKVVDLASPAGHDMMVGSPVMNKATEGGDTVPGVTYYNVSSKYDEFVRMSSTNPNFQQGPAVTNVEITDGCDKEKSAHLSLPYNVRAFALLFNFLAGSQVSSVPCVVSVPVLGTAFSK